LVTQSALRARAAVKQMTAPVNAKARIET